jgi:hypothetical protein
MLPKKIFPRVSENVGRKQRERKQSVTNTLVRTFIFRTEGIKMARVGSFDDFGIALLFLIRKIYFMLRIAYFFLFRHLISAGYLGFIPKKTFRVL